MTQCPFYTGDRVVVGHGASLREVNGDTTGVRVVHVTHRPETGIVINHVVIDGTSYMHARVFLDDGQMGWVWSDHMSRQP